MTIGIIVLLVLAIFFHGTLKFWWNDYEVSTHFNWLALASLILYLIQIFH